MAIMIPSEPQEFDPKSKEGDIFKALKKLSDDYYVFHSFKIATYEEVYEEREGDFVIFNKSKGIICIEAKAGKVGYSGGRWRYSDGTPMKKGGPFRQADSYKFKLIDYIEQLGYKDIINRCKFLHAVWFPSITQNDLKGINLPAECIPEQILTMEALTEPQKFIDQVYAIKVMVGGDILETDLSSNEENIVISKVLCPEFDIMITGNTKYSLKKIRFNQLLSEQKNVLNFLVEQKSAIINGAAGTGKTMIALEKAYKNAELGESVLFLCYNSALKNYLSIKYSRENVDIYTIDGFACKICKTPTANYDLFFDILIEMNEKKTFPYKHVVIDEGQDFGIQKIEESEVIDLIRTNVLEKGGSFYVFYDKLQLIQGYEIPAFITDADCKLTLYRNCRNTENIARASLKPINRKPILMNGCVVGAPAKITFCKTDQKAIEQIDKTIVKLKKNGLEDIVILTCKTIDQSLIADYISDKKYKNDIQVSTCRKYKGLEADGVILIDVERETFDPDNVLLYYVGTSRARLELSIITTMDDEDCKSVLTNALKWETKIRNPKNDLATALDTIGLVK